ncbi:type II secretion system GspH family protein [Pseudomonas aeruginosa]|nr:type II secretion system GspH family protein [Pseudomonas aeruginosa]MCS8510183.1 type II secretion system GspH family protein [Pseudomonas aeruginosa]MCS8541309.1 type II secretion system GspH family protein [Pseudomonas aeruginosa]MCT0600455.1 type II secretion system GspH family protein [Pseudomonas aeruginosa]
MFNSRGFTLIELAVVMMIVSVIAMLTTPNMMNEINHRRADVSIEETQLILDAARSYRIAYSKWPGDSTCSNAIDTLRTTTPAMLPPVGPLNRYNSPYSTSCTSRTFSVDQNAVADWDGYIVNAIAGSTIHNASTAHIRTTIGIPGSEPALDSKLSRIATGNAELNRMRTNLLLGGNDIKEVADIEARSARLSENLHVQLAATIDGLLTANGVSQFEKEARFDDLVVLNKIVSENSVCSRKGAIARDTSGATLHCEDGRWSKGGGVDGTYQYIGSYTGSATLNSGNRPVMVQVIGGSATTCGGDGENRFSLQAIVGGSTVAYSRNNNSLYAKVGYIAFGVPANTAYTIHSTPYNCPVGTFSVRVFRL